MIDGLALATDLDDKSEETESVSTKVGSAETEFILSNIELDTINILDCELPISKDDLEDELEEDIKGIVEVEIEERMEAGVEFSVEVTLEADAVTENTSENVTVVSIDD